MTQFGGCSRVLLTDEADLKRLSPLDQTVLTHAHIAVRMTMIERPTSAQPIPPNATKVFQGKLFSVFQWQERLFDGSLSTFEKAKRPDTVLIIPVLDDGRIVVCRQAQPGRQSFIGAIGGRIEENEEALTAAARELLEEAGYTASRYHLWFSLQPTLKVDWAVYAFIAKGLAPRSSQSLDLGERIELLYLTFDEFLALPEEPSFSEPEMVPLLLRARFESRKREDLQALLSK